MDGSDLIVETANTAEVQPDRTETSTPAKKKFVTPFDGTEGILVDLNAKKYYQLNETATLIWKGIANRAPIVEIANSLAASYEVTPEDAQRNVQTMVQQFKDYKLIGID